MPRRRKEDEMDYCSEDERTFAPTEWRRIPAINGRGWILIGPDMYYDGPGAMVIAPPGVLLRTPEGREPLSRAEWRQARWGVDADGHVLIDQARPLSLIEVSLGQVVDDLAEWAPGQLHWVVSVIERHLRILIGRMPRDCYGEHHPKASAAFSELTEMRRNADEAFARLRSHPCKPGEWLLDKPFLRIEQTYIAEVVADRKRVGEALQGSTRESGESQPNLRLVTDVDLDPALNPEHQDLS
jgi:hypothetical protein